MRTTPTSSHTSSVTPNARQMHVVVVGAGVGGLTTGTLLADAGYDVTVLEAEAYVGGCAGTYFHKGYRFDVGATLAGGFQPGGPHDLIAQRLGLEWPVRPSDPAWVVHLPDRAVTLTRDAADVLAQFPASEPFWREQRRVADLMWTVAGEGLPWPPRSGAEWAQLTRVAFRHLIPLAGVSRHAFGTVGGWLQRLGLHTDPVFRRFLDAQLLISAQTTSQSAHALYGATALDLPRQGVQHVAGGMGGIAETLVAAIEARGGKVLRKHTVTRLDVADGRVTGVHTRKGRQPGEHFACDVLVANLLPQSFELLMGEADAPGATQQPRDRDMAWGAFVLHVGLTSDTIPANLPDHHQIVTSYNGALGEGRSIFVSFSPVWDASRAPDGHRAVTVSTHTRVDPWWALAARDRDAYEARKAAYTQQVLDAVDAVIPGFRSGADLILPGTPVTYHSFTGRYRGLVGGIPQTSLFKARGPRVGLDNVRLVGDSIFPGQSTAGVTLGALRVAADIVRAWPPREAVHHSYRRPARLEAP